MTKAQKIAQSEIAKGKEIIERYSQKKPQMLIEKKIQERIDFLESLNQQEIEKAEFYLECSVTGGIHNFESLKKMLNK